MPIQLSKNVRLPVNDRVCELMYDADVLKEVKQIMIHGAPSDRTPDRAHELALAGLAVQYAVLELFEIMGAEYIKPEPGVFQFDGILDGVKVDIKVRFDGKRWQQSRWEAEKLKETGERVLYICVDVTLDCAVIFKGCIWDDELEPSVYGSPFVLTHKLQHLNLE